ncbi:MAG: bifunctional ADP-heptose synthase [Archangium sp.]
MSRVLDQFSKVRVLLVGDLLADHYVYGQTERISREAPVLIVRHEREELKLGGGANAAANARALGAKVTALGVLGRDVLGGQMKKLFKATGIALEAVTVASTEARTRILAGGISTKRQQMLRIDRGATGPLATSTRKQLASRLLAAARKADVVMVSDYGAGVLNDETRDALRAVAARGTPVCVDSRFDLGLYRGMTVCKPNEPELAAFTGLSVKTDKEIERAAMSAMEKLDCRILLVTRGRRGMVLFERNQRPIHIPVHGAEEAVDVTGAGDTVSATFALALGTGASAFEAARLANVAGALVVQKAGTATVTRPELEREISR